MTAFPYPPSEPLFWWWLQMVICAIFNVILFALAWWKTQANVYAKHAAHHLWSWRYCVWMRLLAIPYVFECVWRSFLPCQYDNRITIIDNPVNSVLAARLLAAVGESCWAIQFSWAIRVIAWHIPLRKGGPKSTFFVRSVIPVITYVTSVVACVAQIFSIAGMVSTNYYYNVWEESLWACIFILATTCSISIWVLGTDDGFCNLICKNCVQEVENIITSGGGAIQKPADHHHDDFSIWVMRIFIRALSIIGLIAALYTCFYDVPHWQSLYLLDQSEGDTYFTVDDGFYDAANTRHPNQTIAAWSTEFFWMSGYFFFAAMSSIILMFAPGRVKAEACDCPLHPHGVVLDP